MNKFIKIILISLSLSFIFSSNVWADELEKGKCSADLILTQNLKAPKVGEKYIRNGSYHWYTKEKVRQADILQKHLNRLGFNAGKVDGIIGPKTRGAILRMQKFLGTVQDGYVGPKTRALLNNSCKESKEEKEAEEVVENKTGEDIIVIAHKMALVDKVIVKGSCWDFLDRVYDDAGYSRDKRKTIFSSSKNNGPYADIDLIKPGDWLYYVNYSYNQVEHSGLFIEWIDKQDKIAKILSYAGQNRDSPGRYRNYDLKSVYNIIRGE